VSFSLEEVHHSARALLDLNPNAVVACRLMRQVLRLPPSDATLMKLKDEALHSKWIRQLEEAQLPDGSFGRFHTQDTQVKSVFRTTEEAIDRAIALGLEPGDEVLARTQRYILSVMHGDAQITDHTEKGDSWPVLIKLILTGRLAQLNPENRLLEDAHAYLVEVARQSFTSGDYRLEDERAAFLRLSGIHMPRGFLRSQHVLYILSALSLPAWLERLLVGWIWQNPEGIGYLQVPLRGFQPRKFGYWLRSMDIITRFASWREVAAQEINKLWAEREESGWWDFGTPGSKSIDFPLSDSWVRPVSRKIDHSTRVLGILRKYFD
jgi:hypothetical protein